MSEAFNRPLLQSLFDEAAQYDPEYGAGLSNHLPMAWLALARLGAGEARLREFGAGYAADKQLVPRRERAAWPAGDAWAGRFGQRRAWPIYLDLFEQWLAHEGAADVLAQTLPALLPGVAAAAFHGLIRTAAGVQAGHAGEVAQGLAHWACFFLPLGALPQPARRATPVAEPARLLRRMQAGSSNAGTIAARMRAAAAAGEVNALAARLLIDAHTPERLARAAAFAYAETGNFTVLHLVTGTHAMRVLVRFVDGGAAPASSPLPGRQALQAARAAEAVAAAGDAHDAHDAGDLRDADATQAAGAVGTLAAGVHTAWRSFWQAYAHGVVAARLVPSSRALVLRAWPEIIAAALSARDEHVIKLVDAAREEEHHYGGDDWRRAASRAVMAVLG